jgi:TIR domain
MPDADEIEQQQQLITTYRRTLASLLQQAAQYGGESFAPPITTNGIPEARVHIRHAKRALRGWHVTVDDHPNDEPAGALADAALSQTDERRARLQALCADHSGFIRDRLDSFVGRAAELAEIHARIAEVLPDGGYITITGQAGQGKSSVIAKLVDEYGPETVAHHFIPFNPGPDHQVSLLRNLMARLILKHDLSELYVASESRPALRDYFVKILKEIADNPDNLFSLSIDRLKHQREQWHSLIKPVLGCLLVARESLSQRALRDLISAEGDALREALSRLGGLVARDAGGKYYLYHLKLRDFLRFDPQRPNKGPLFDQDEAVWRARRITTPTHCLRHSWMLVSSPLQNLNAENRHALVERIGEANYVIAILSPASLSNQQTQLEWDIALERYFLTGAFSLLPVKIAALDDSQIPKQLAALSTVDFTKPDKLEMAFAYLLSIWKQ